MTGRLAARWLPIWKALDVRRLGDIGWVHGANSRQALLDALSDPRVQFIEGDISVVGGEIIMAHPPVMESDLGFESWLDLTIRAGKGAKLDFKSRDAVAHCLSYAAKHAAGKIPLCANADVLTGPGGEQPPCKPDEFMGLCNRLLPQAFVSLGWTVETGASGYTGEMLDETLKSLTEVDAAVTLCFFAGYLQEAWPQLEAILAETEYTFTIWGRTDDASLVEWIRDNTPPERCFYDVQWRDGTQIHMASY